jgi:hypothetical protein
MPQIIGVVLIVYGIVGLIGTILLHRWLSGPHGPIARLRQRLLTLAGQLHEGSISAQQTLQLARHLRTRLQSVADKVHDMTDVLRRIAELVSATSSEIGQLRPLTDAFKLTVPTSPASTTVIPQTGFSVEVVTGVKLGHTSIPVGPRSVDVATPPLEVDKSRVGFNLGPLTVISSLNFTDIYPLEPFGQVYGTISQVCSQVSVRITELAAKVDDAGELPGETRAALDQLINHVLTPLPGTLEQASLEAGLAASSNLLGWGPLLGCGYLGLMHVAFAITGLALLFT